MWNDDAAGKSSGEVRDGWIRLGAPDLAGVRTRTAGDQASGAHGGLLRGREGAGEERKEKGKPESGDRAAA